MAKSEVSSVGGVMKLLQSGLGGAIPLFGALATMDAEGLASARMMVIRGIDDGVLWMSTHAGSEKVEHLRSHPVGEVVVWLQEKRVQLRLRGTWRVVDRAAAARNELWATRREQAWQEQSEETRRMFFGPAPGQRIKPRARRPATGAINGEPPAAFAVLLGTLERIDALWIKKPAHERYLHERIHQEWRTLRVTP